METDPKIYLDQKQNNVYKILIVEDTLIIKEEVYDILSLEGYEVFQAENGKIGYQVALKKLPDLIISDILMPKLNGFEMFEKLQKHKKTKNIPLIFLSAKGEKEDIRSGMNAGAEDYLVKPINTEELVKVVRNKLEKQQLVKDNISKLVDENSFLLKEAGRMAKIGYWTYDRKTNTTRWSKAVHQIFKTDPKQGMPKLSEILNFFEKESKQQLTEAIKSLSSKGTHFDIEVQLTNLKNEKCWIQNIGEPLYNNKNKIIGSRGIIRDITSLKNNQEALKKSNERYKFINLATNDAVWDWDLLTDKIYRNRKGFNKVFGFDDTINLEEMRMEDYVHIEDNLRVEKAIKEIIKDPMQNNFAFEYAFLSPSGEKIYIEDKGFILRDKKGVALRIIGAASNITKQNNFKESLEEALEEAEKLSGFKDQFLANMSHEIRTPLNGIIGFTKILLRSSITEKQKEQLTAIKVSGDILMVVINDVLDLAKIEAGKMVLEETEIKIPHLINSTLSTFELRLDEKEQTLHTYYDKNIPDWVLGDSIRINQILLNLIANAIKFTKKGGAINVDVNLLKEEEDTVIIKIKISDTGIGIAEDKIKNIFDSFTQSDRTTSRKYGGSGLGLSIVKQLMDLMKGTISVKSQLNIGSTFTLIIPLTKTAVTTNETELVVTSDKILELVSKLEGFEKLKILIVDDMVINQLLAKTILESIGFETEVAENGKVAIELIDKNTYDIILMDLQMPEMSGWEATEYIRNKMEPPKSTIPIIALTADVSQKNADKCIKAGMNEYVSKPINETTLLHKVTRLVVEKRTAENGKRQGLAKISNLDSLKGHCRNKPERLAQMLQIILKETPVVIEKINKCVIAADWSSLHINVHKIKPTLHLIGLPQDTIVAANQIEASATAEENLDLIPNQLIKLEKALSQAYKELEAELQIIKN